MSDRRSLPRSRATLSSNPSLITVSVVRNTTSPPRSGANFSKFFKRNGDKKSDKEGDKEEPPKPKNVKLVDGKNGNGGEEKGEY